MTSLSTQVAGSRRCLLAHTWPFPRCQRSAGASLLTVVLPLAGYFAARWDDLSARGALGVIAVVGLFYVILTGGTFLLALLETPLVASFPLPAFPSSLAAGILLALSAAGVWVLAATWDRLS
jgi:hypothetical protein